MRACGFVRTEGLWGQGRSPSLGFKAILQDAGIEDFTAHSYRSVASSAMAQAGVSIQDIMKKAGWTNANTFYKFYYRKDKPISIRGQNKNSVKNTILNYFENPKK